MLFLWRTFHVIFDFQLGLGLSHYFSRIHGVETVNLSPLPLFYVLPNVPNFVTKISLKELYNRIISNIQTGLHIIVILVNKTENL
jgi:hypothetical protein